MSKFCTNIFFLISTLLQNTSGPQKFVKITVLKAGYFHLFSR